MILLLDWLVTLKRNSFWRVDFKPCDYVKGQGHDLFYSSTIKTVRYFDEEARLEITFWSSEDRIYSYSDVDQNTAHELVTNESAGSFFSKRIRDMYSHEVLEHGEIEKPSKARAKK
jgi:hypothetical protein